MYLLYFPSLQSRLLSAWHICLVKFFPAYHLHSSRSKIIVETVPSLRMQILVVGREISRYLLQGVPGELNPNNHCYQSFRNFKLCRTVHINLGVLDQIYIIYIKYIFKSCFNVYGYIFARKRNGNLFSIEVLTKSRINFFILLVLFWTLFSS